ncbi:MAG: S49 family peptidase [Burkholderiaceae bacterium]|jgi:signal peptide peptidase SppA|nr:S49 family peptidase [Burkholderiaceae bacterium]
MTLIDLLRSAWAIMPDRLDEIQAIYAAHFRGEKIDIDAIEARLGRPLANEQQEYAMRDGGVAVLPIEGVIAAKANLFTRISGGASAQMLTQQVQSMRADTRVRSAIIALDTPGGSVFGLPELAGEIRALAAEKPVVAVSTGMMASAGYWIGSAANAVFASGATDLVGSIGVVMRHTYDPRAKDTTEIVAGRYKRIATDAKPLSKEGAAYLQQQVDAIYEAFVETVAENRRVSVDQVLEHMADGRVFVGKQAKAAGLIDGFATVDDLADRLATDPDKFAQRRRAMIAGADLGAEPAIHSEAPGAVPAATADEPVPPVATATTPSEVHMTPQEAAAKFAAENPEAAAVLRGEGASAELQRVVDVRAAALPGHEKLIDALAADGKTSGAEAALAVLAAERQTRTAQASARAADAPPVVPQAEAPEAEPKAAADKPFDAAKAAEVADKARTLVAQAKAQGRTLTTSQAVAQVLAGETA